MRVFVAFLLSFLFFSQQSYSAVSEKRIRSLQDSFRSLALSSSWKRYLEKNKAYFIEEDMDFLSSVKMNTVPRVKNTRKGVIIMSDGMKIEVLPTNNIFEYMINGKRVRFKMTESLEELAEKIDMAITEHKSTSIFRAPKKFSILSFFVSTAKANNKRTNVAIGIGSVLIQVGERGGVREELVGAVTSSFCSLDSGQVSIRVKAKNMVRTVVLSPQFKPAEEGAIKILDEGGNVKAVSHYGTLSSGNLNVRGRSPKNRRKYENYKISLSNNQYRALKRIKQRCKLFNEKDQQVAGSNSKDGNKKVSHTY